MGEVQFAKSFLSTLDSKQTKYKPDHVFDPNTFETRIPYTLPKLPHPPHPLPPTSAEASDVPPGSEAAVPTITIVLKSTRNPALSLTLTSLNPTTTTIQQLKDSIQSSLGGPSVLPSTDKIKVLWNKKPIPSSKKTVVDALEGMKLEAGGGTEQEIEFGVMVMGGAPDPPSQPGPAETPVVQPTGPGSEQAAVEAESTAKQPEAMEGIESVSTSAPVVQPGEASGKEVLATSEFWDDLEGFLGQRIKDATEAKNVRDIFQTAWKSTSSLTETQSTDPTTAADPAKRNSWKEMLQQSLKPQQVRWLQQR